MNTKKVKGKKVQQRRKPVGTKQDVGKQNSEKINKGKLF